MTPRSWDAVVLSDAATITVAVGGFGTCWARLAPRAILGNGTAVAWGAIACAVR